MGKIVHIKVKRRNSKRVEDAVSVWRNEAKKGSDELGSYTGLPSEKDDLIPEQDPDDL